MTQTATSNPPAQPRHTHTQTQPLQQPIGSWVTALSTIRCSLPISHGPARRSSSARVTGLEALWLLSPHCRPPPAPGSGSVVISAFSAPSPRHPEIESLLPAERPQHSMYTSWPHLPGPLCLKGSQSPHPQGELCLLQEWVQPSCPSLHQRSCWAAMWCPLKASWGWKRSAQAWLERTYMVASRPGCRFRQLSQGWEGQAQPF